VLQKGLNPYYPFTQQTAPSPATRLVLPQALKQKSSVANPQSTPSPQRGHPRCNFPNRRGSNPFHISEPQKVARPTNGQKCITCIMAHIIETTVLESLKKPRKWVWKSSESKMCKTALFCTFEVSYVLCSCGFVHQVGS
jgi:hypothetical protein